MVILYRALKRHEILESLKFPIPQLELKIKVPELNREQETNLIIKQLLGLKVSQ